MTLTNLLPSRRGGSLATAVALLLTLLFSAPASAVEVGAGPGSVSGVVSTAGSPLAGLSVQIYPLIFTGAVPPTEITGADGSYSFTGLDLANYYVTVQGGAGYKYTPSQNVALTELVPNATHDFSLVPIPTGNASLSGSISDAASGLGLAAVSISVYGSASEASASVETDSDGGFSLVGLPGGETYFLSIFAFGYVYVYEPVFISIDEDSFITRALTPANSAIVGTVVDSHGQPLQGIWVDVQSTLSGGQAITDEFGNYSVSTLGPGPATVSVGGTFTAWEAQSKNITLEPSETETVGFTLQSRVTGDILGYVLSTTGPDGGGFGIQNICTTVYKAGTSKVVAQGAPSSTEATFKITGIKPGKYTLKFTDCDPARSPKFASEYWVDASHKKHATLITIVAGEDVNINEVVMDLEPIKARK